MTNAITTKKAELQNSKKGFTLVELVVVIAILAILAAIAIPVVNSIINTATKNGAESDGQSIELAIKEAQSYIASGSTEIYDGAKKVDVDAKYTTTGGADIASGQITLANAKTDHANLNVAMVAAAKQICNGFESVSYYGKDYFPYWNKTTQKCIFLTKDGSDYKNFDGTVVSGVGTSIVQLSQAGASQGVTDFCDVNIDSLD